MRLVLVLGLLIGFDYGAAQGPPLTAFVGAWRSTAEPPGGPASFTIEQQGQRLFVSIAGARPAKIEATVYLTPPARGSKTGPSAGPLVVTAEERMFIIKQAEGGNLTLEMYTRPKEPARRPVHLMETFKKTP